MEKYKVIKKFRRAIDGISIQDYGVGDVIELDLQTAKRYLKVKLIKKKGTPKNDVLTEMPKDTEATVR